MASDLATVAEADEQSAGLAETMSRMQPEQQAAAEAREQAFAEKMKSFDNDIATARLKIAPIGPFERALNLEKSWHILNYLFTGHFDAASAPGNALLTGDELGDDVGYGPARLHSALETRHFAQFLAPLEVARLNERIRYQELSRASIYGLPEGAGTVSEFEDELRNEVAFYFPRLKNYETFA